MRNAKKCRCRLSAELLRAMMMLCVLLLVGCRSSYVDISDGKGWDTLGYQTGAPSDPSNQTSPSGSISDSSAVILPDRSTDPATPASSDLVLTDTPTLTTQTETERSTESEAPENPGESLTVLEFTQTVAKGSKATVSIRGLPDTEYTIKVKYSSGYSSAAGLEPQISDADGVCSWTWRVGGSTKPGSYPITISDGTNSYSLTFTVE